MKNFWWALGILPLVACSGGERAPAARGQTLDRSGYLYDPADRSCGGFPRLAVDTMPGTCLGMVLPASRLGDGKKDFVMPRTIVAIPGTPDFLVADMGGWKANNGTLYRVFPGADGQYQAEALRRKLNMPHGLAWGPDGLLYLGETQQITRFRWRNGTLENPEVVVGGLPRFEGHMHPLTQFTFDPRNGDLFINSGAPSDHCYVKETGSYSDCPEESAQGLGAIYRVPAKFLRELRSGGAVNYEVVASGLRNSMAMVVHPAGTLVQGENSRDFPEQEEPFEEINVVDLARPGFHYGWPYCYNFHAVSPEWRFPENKNDPLRQRFGRQVDCSLLGPRETGEYQAPHALMPPHVAPLFMAYYHGAMFPELEGRLLVSWHGHQPTGQRLVSYKVDEKGRPLTVKAGEGESYLVNGRSGCPGPRPFRPAGGVDRIAPYTEVISRWNKVEGQRPKGAPVGFTVAADGSIWIAEDREARSIVRLAKDDRPAQNGNCVAPRAEPDPKIELLAWRHALAQKTDSLAAYGEVKKQLVQKYCVGCHGNFLSNEIAADQFAELDFFFQNGWIEPGSPEQSKLYAAISHSGEVPPMPPGGSPQFYGSTEGNGILRLVSDWVRGLPTDVKQSFARTVMADGRRLRDRPSTSGTVCGQLDKGEVVYVDPRSDHYEKADGWFWTKAYFVPGDTRLFRDGCAYPADGVFYLATRKSP